MNVFRLVLCLAGLIIYLVVKQFLLSGQVPQVEKPPTPSQTPDVRHQEGTPVTPNPGTHAQMAVARPETPCANAGR